MSKVIVSSEVGLGYGGLRALYRGRESAAWGPDAIRDPRAVRRRVSDQYLVVNEPAAVWLLDFAGIPLASIGLPPGLDPGGGAFAEGDTYYFGSRARRSIERIDLAAHFYCGTVLKLEGMEFPRGFAVLDDGGFVVASGTHPVLHRGRRAVFRYGADGRLIDDAFIEDRDLDPLDLAVHDGYIYITSEMPLGAADAVVSLRRYDMRNGEPAEVWSAANTRAFAAVKSPRGIAFDDDGTLLICARNCVIAVSVSAHGIASIFGCDDRLAGQSLAAIPRLLVG